jgi:hypothetical protein
MNCETKTAVGLLLPPVVSCSSLTIKLEKHMKLIFKLVAAMLIILVVLPNISFSQDLSKYYIITRGGQEKNYDLIKSTYFGKFICYEGQTKQKYKGDELKSVLIAKEPTYSTSTHAQIVFKKFTMNGGLYNYSVADGKKAMEVIVSNGTDMILSEWGGSITAPGTLISQTFTSSSMYGSNVDQIYFVKGTSAVVINLFNMYDKEFLDELIAAFGSCEAVNAVLTEYRNSGAKPVTVLEAIFRLKDAYYTSCYIK